MFQDLVIFHRLEHVCFCVESGEWPFPKRMPFFAGPGGDSRSATPTGTPKQDDLSDTGDSFTDGMKVTQGTGGGGPSEKDFQVQMAEVGFMHLWLVLHRRSLARITFPVCTCMCGEVARHVAE
jgi:hypothetical protein